MDVLLREVRVDASRIQDPQAFPFQLPVIRALHEPLEFDAEATILVGENGSGKSTLVEAIASKLELDAEGGDTVLTFVQPDRTALADALVLTRGARSPSMRYFLRAESFFNVAEEVDRNAGALEAHGGRPLHEQSHGESFLRLAAERFEPDGIFILDEPEAALSPQGCLTLLRRLKELTLDGAQVIMATHSPILMAFPGATVYELGPEGAEPVAFRDTDHFRLLRSFLDDPDGFLHHLMR